jgi:hypothetical protein
VSSDDFMSAILTYIARIGTVARLLRYKVSQIPAGGNIHGWRSAPL